MDASDLQDVLDSVRDFIRTEVVPLEETIDAEDAVPERIVAQCKEMGLYGFTIPEEYGGLGLAVSEEVRLAFELGWTTPALRSLFGTNNGIAGHVLMEGGTEEQKQEWLPRLASGEVTASFGLTEADAGSDPSSLATKARPGRGRVGPQRLQALHHELTGRRRDHGVRAHQPGRAGHPRHLHVPGARRHAGPVDRPEGPQDGPVRRLDRRRVPRRRPGARGERSSAARTASTPGS